MANIFVSAKRREAILYKRMRSYCFNRAGSAIRRNDLASFVFWNRLALDYGRKYTIAYVEFRTIRKGA